MMASTAEKWMSAHKITRTSLNPAKKLLIIYYGRDLVRAPVSVK